MPTVKVRMYATVRESAGKPEAEVDAVDLEGLLRRLAELFGQRFSKLLSGAGDEGLVILVNGRNVKPGSRKNVRFCEGDEVSIFPPVSGG